MGSGYRVFTAGEVLTASNVQDYLMDQSVMSFADSTARATSIGTANFEEGMVSYLQNTNQLEVYNGSAWASIAPTSTQGLTLINSTSFSGVASQSVNDVFSTTYTNYRVVANITFSTTAYLNVRMRVAGADNSSNEYVYIVTSVASNQSVENSGSNGLVSSFAEFTRQTVDSTVLAYDFLNPFDTKNTVVLGSGVWNRSASLINGGWYNGILKNNTSYTGFTLIAQTGNITGTVSVYGYNK
jgi:hypothetical protein